MWTSLQNFQKIFWIQDFLLVGSSPGLVLRAYNFLEFFTIIFVSNSKGSRLPGTCQYYFQNVETSFKRNCSCMKRLSESCIVLYLTIFIFITIKTTIQTSFYITLMPGFFSPFKWGVTNTRNSYRIPNQTKNVELIESHFFIFSKKMF